MTRLHKDDIDLIAKTVTERQEEAAKSYWIEAEEHYRDHLNHRELWEAFKSARGLMWKSIIGLAAFGSLIATGVYGVWSILKIKGGA